MATAPTWGESGDCPFCGTELASPGAGFVDHIHENPACESEFDTWKTNVANDIRGGWSG